MELKKFVRQIKHAIHNLLLRLPLLRFIIINRFLKKIEENSLNGCRTAFEENLDEAFSTFLTEKQRADELYCKKVIKDIAYCWLRYNAKPTEYFLYHFDKIGHDKRKTFVVDIVKDCLLVEEVGLEQLYVLKDKYNFYLAMKEYFHREVIKIVNEKDFQVFREFVKKHKRFIIKPITGARGWDTTIYEVSDDNVDMIFSKILSLCDKGVVIEELILQSEELARYNYTSVNTVRLPAFLTKKGWIPWKPAFRTGRKGSVVDNAGQGGIVIALDEKTGAFLGKAADERGHVFSTHPDSNLSLVNGQIPYWKELLSLAEKIHRKMPKQKYVGWDFALTDKGWVLVEGNWGQPIWQFPMQQGLLPEFVAHLTDKD